MATSTPGIAPLTRRPAWDALKAHHAQVKDVHLRELFASDPIRGERLVAEAAGLYLDYSKNRITVETVREELARSPNIEHVTFALRGAAPYEAFQAAIAQTAAPQSASNVA